MKNEDNWRIIMNAYEVVDLLIIDPAVHFEFIFEGPNGFRKSFNGYPLFRDTGEHAPAGSPENKTLRVIADYTRFMEDSYTDSRPLPMASAVVFEGGLTEFADKLHRAAEAGAFINGQDLDYIVINPTGASPGQNSNSVIYTLANAMDLEIPPEMENLWAPGYGRLLLPEDFASFFDKYPITADNICEFGFPATDGSYHGFYVETTSAFHFMTYEQEVVESIRDANFNEKTPSADFFDPRNPLPYDPEPKRPLMPFFQEDFVSEEERPYCHRDENKNLLRKGAIQYAPP